MLYQLDLKVFCILFHVFSFVILDSEERLKNYNVKIKPFFEKWSYNNVTNIMASVDPYDEYCAIVEHLNSYCGLFNGVNGSAMILNIITGQAVYLSKKLSEETWYNSKTSFQNYVHNLKKMQTLYDFGKQNNLLFDASSINEEVMNEVGKIMTALSQDYTDSCKAFGIFYHLCSTAVKGLQQLKTFDKTIGNVLITKMRGDFRWLSGLFQGLNWLFEKIPDGFTTLNKKNINIDIRELLKAPSGFDAAAYFIKQIVEKIDIGKVMEDALNNPQMFFTMINGLSGNVHYNTDGFFAVISKLVDFVTNAGSLVNVEEIVKDFFRDDRTNLERVKKEYPIFINRFIQTIKDLNLENSLKDLMTTLQNILQSQWTLNGINISKVITIITNSKSKKDSEKAIDEIKKIIKSKE